ncbi:MAG: energy transducer TonB [Brachymonas sp.]
MSSAATSRFDRLDFYPPRAQGTGRAISLALIAHLLLVGALTWGVSWNRQASVTTVEAELWSATPQQAAPKLQDVPQPPPAQPVVTPEPAPPKAPDIALEQQKPKPPKPEVKVEPKPEPKPQPRPEAKANPVQEAKRLAEQKEAERQKNLQRMAGLAGASGAPSAQGSALQTSGMASGWDARVKARVNPQINYTGERSALKDLELSISILPDGTIASRPRIIKSSGSPQWDEAVARAFEKTEILPRDTHGKLPPSPFILTWKARE